jgi:hypothetical protein
LPGSLVSVGLAAASEVRPGFVGRGRKVTHGL